jgi:transposase
LAKRGRTRTFTAWDRLERLTFIAALTLDPNGHIGQYIKIQWHKAKAESFPTFLHYLKKQLLSPMIVIWDRLSAGPRIVQAFRELDSKGVRFEYLPTYSPELNPLDYRWTTTKGGRLSNRANKEIMLLKDRLDCFGHRNPPGNRLC